MANFTLGVTNAGLSLLTRAIAGETLTFTAVRLGSGQYTGAVSAAEGLAEPEVTLSLDGIVRKGTQVTVKAVLQYGEVASGFTWTEVGLFAEDPDGGSDILYAYGYAGDAGDYIPGSGEATLNEKVIRMTTLVSTAANVTVQLSGSTVYATLEDLNDMKDEIDLTIQNFAEIIQQVTGVDPSDPEAELPPGSMVVTLSHEKDGTIHKLTGLGGRTGIIPCQFKATGDYAEGEVFLLDGTPYTARQENGDTLSDGQFVSGAGVAVVVDTEGKRINFKGGGGVGAADLALATATEATVFSGKTFYAGESKELRTGTALSQAVSVTANNIPPGVTAYNQAGQVITGNGSGVLKYSEHAHQFNQNSTSITFTCGFNVKMAIAYMSSLGASNRGVTGGVILPGGTSGQFRINDGNTNSGCTGSFSFSGNKLTASLEVPGYISSGRMYVDFVAIGM